VEESVSWEQSFPDYKVDKAILEMVRVGYVRDTSGEHDPAPSFSAPLHGKRFIRLWVEHPNVNLRRAGPHRYRVEITRRLSQEGRPWIETDSLAEAVSYTMAAIENEGFRLAG
jgi:hypothetical protein